MLTPSFPKCWIEKNRTIQYVVCICRCSLPRFQYKVTVLFHLKLKRVPLTFGQKVNTAGGNFFTGWWEPEEEWFWFWRFEPFSKVKTAFCEYWTSIEIKLTWRFLFSGRGVDFWLRRNKNLLRGGVGESTEAGIFPDEGRMKLPPPPSRPILPVGKSLAC